MIAQRLKATLDQKAERGDYGCNRCVDVYRSAPDPADTTCRLGTKIRFTCCWRGTIMRRKFLFSIIPDCILFPLEFEITRLIAAVLVDHNRNVLEHACLVTEQQVPSTFQQPAHVGDSISQPSARDSRKESCFNCGIGYTYLFTVSPTARQAAEELLLYCTRTIYVRHQHTYSNMRQTATQQHSSQVHSRKRYHTYFIHSCSARIHT